MHSRSRSLSLIFILSFAAIFIYSSTHHNLKVLNPNRNPNPILPRRNLNPQNFTFTIKLLTFDRIGSLRRCLRSLATADYGGDRANLHIFVDHFRDLEAINGSSMVDQKLEDSRQILDLLDRFQWKHGDKLVHYRTGNAGLQAQWLEAWWPASDEDFAFVVEDDLELSPLYYRFLKGLIMKYYYDRSNYSPSIYGASLQRPRFVSGKHGNKLQVDGETRLFLYQMVGTWGQLLFPKPWKEFRLWYDAHKAKGIKPFLQGMVSTGWYKKMGERIWTPWFIKFIQSRGYYNIYTNFLHEKALSISHRDAGVNYGRSAGPDSSLLDEGPTDFNIWEMPPLTNLRWYDFCFSEVYFGRVVGSYEELGLVLSLIQKQRTVVLISLYRTEQRIARNLLCHLERLGLGNFILVGGSTEFLMDLARRGYPVIVSDRMVNNIRNFGSAGNRRSEMDMVKEILVKASVIRKSLELGFDTWVVDGNIIPLEYPFSKPLDTSYSFFAAEEVELMMVKSSQESLKVWVDDFISEVVSAGKSLMDVNSFRAEHRHFAYIATKALKKSAGVKVSRLDESAFYEKIGDGFSNRTSLERGKKMVFWPRETASDSVQRELERLELWLIDEESSCVAVVCR